MARLGSAIYANM